MLDEVQKRLHSLSAAERRVAARVLDDPSELINCTLAELAAASGVSEPTVLRFCRSLGASGFREFKTRVTQHLAVVEHVIHADVSSSDDTDAVISKVIGRSIKELIAVRQQLDTVVARNIVNALATAKRIDFYGIGASGIVVNDAQNKFFRLGIPCNAYADSPTLLQAAAITNESYAVFLVSKTGTTKPIIKAAKIALQQGAQVCAITSPGSQLSNIVDRSLLVDVNEDTGIHTPMSSRLAQLAILDSLQVATALKLGDRGRQSLGKTKHILRR